MSDQPSRISRLHELLADEQLGQLTPEDRSELEMLRIELNHREPNTIGEFLVALDSYDQGQGADAAPEELVGALIQRGRAMMGSGSGLGSGSDRMRIDPGSQAGRAGPHGTMRFWKLTAIAATLLAAVSIVLFVRSEQQQARLDRDYSTRIAGYKQQIEENNTLLASARARSEQLAARLGDSSTLIDEQASRLAALSAREVDLAQQLADATSELDEAHLRITRYETPVDPAQLAQNRRELLRVPDTIRLAWQPFNLPESPSEQPDVRGDVVWNDELEQGYLRFVGLDVNDPEVEQYQVWVIDERGMEQKVSGGVFNASADGEVIVPIHPGIDIGRVALFAITIEEPGGTWVPNLKRRVVLAPRAEEG